MKNITPVMSQYLEIKGENPDAILFFRMGDFYEMFFDDAVLASRVLGIALTSRDKDRAIAMCGVPHHAARSYIKRLIKEGHKVALCEQVEKAGASKGIVRREVRRVITPGTVLDDGLLEPKSNNFIAAVSMNARTSGRAGRAGQAGRAGLAYMDVSTGEFRLTEFQGCEAGSAIDDELRKISPLELLVEADTVTAEPAGQAWRAVSTVKKVTPVSSYDFDLKTARERLESHFSTASLDGFGCSGFNEGLKAAGALLHYIKDTQRSSLEHIKRLSPYFDHDFLVMDSSTLRNLEIVETRPERRRERCSVSWTVQARPWAADASSPGCSTRLKTPGG